MKDREIIQLTVSAGTGWNCDILYALCSDGTTWMVAVKGEGPSEVGEWKRLPDIPVPVERRI